MERRTGPNLVSKTTAALFGLIVVAASLGMVVPLFRFGGDLTEGDVASRTFSAVHDAQFESAALTDAAREEQAGLVQPVALPVDAAIREQQRERAARYLEQVRVLVARTELTAQQKQDQIAGLAVPRPMTNQERTAILAFDATGVQLLGQKLATALNELMSSAIKEDDIPRGIEDYLSRLPASPGDAGANERTALSALLRTFTVPTFRLDEAATEALRAEARAGVQPVVRTFTRGQVIATEGQQLTAQDIEALKATGVIDDGVDYYAAAGGALIAVALGLALGVYTYLFQPFPAPANRRMVLVAAVFALVLLGSRIVLPLVTPDTESRFYAFALPVSTAAIVAASFADLSFAALLAVAAGLFAAFVGGTAPQIAGSSYVGSLQSLELGMTYTAGGLAGAAAVYRASRLGRYLFSAVAVTLATGGVMAAFWLVSAQREDIDLAWIALAAGIHGAAAAVISVGAFVVLATVFGVTTRLQLMELAQAEHPLLRRLQDEAPGTYHHSVLVGALAERAAARIGADALLVRVGAYYHDIGKLAMPGQYVENMLDGTPSPHDGMTAVESARIIRAHVSNGLELGKKYRLPGVVRDFIPQHHGTRLVTYFYRRAAAEGEAIDPADYRYEGPRPQSREAAIVMLADSSEAVARAQQDEGSPPLDQLVDSVFAERLAEGQLDECDITLRDLQAVAASFKATLRAVYHPRVQYPSPTADEIATLARGETPVPGIGR